MKRKRRRILWKKVFAWLLGITVVSGVFYICFRTSTFTITSYELVGVPEEKKDLIINGLNDIAKTPLYKIIPSNRIFSYRGLRIKSLISKVLPNTERISFLPVGFHTLRITTTSYTPLFRIDGIHAITSTGVVYEESKDISFLPQLEIASSTTKTIDKDGISTTMIEGDANVFLSMLSSIVSNINSVLFTVSKIYVDTYGDIRLFDIREKSLVLFSRDSDTKKVWSNIVSAIDTDPLKSKLKIDKESLLYLDARFGNKVFYKFRNGGIIETHATTTATTTTVQQ